MADEFIDKARELYKTNDYAKIVEIWGADGSNSDAFKRNAYASYQPTKGDVVISTYPKSGTTWMMQIAYQIGYLGEGAFEHIDRVVPWPDKLLPLDNAEIDDLSFLADSPTGLHVIKSHLEAEYVPYSPEAKYISVVRDPKDMLVSLIHFENGFQQLLFDRIIPAEVWVETFQSDTFIYQPWPLFVDSWWRLRDRDNVLIVSYEALKSDSRAMIQQIARFLEVELTAEQLDKVVEKSSFSYMKANEHKFGLPAWESGYVPLVRTGQTSVAKELLTLEQQADVDAHCLRELERLGSDFPYAKLFNTVTI